MARRAGYHPVLFGYTDQAVDPRVANGPDDPRLTTYEGILPGFDMLLDLAARPGPVAGSGWTSSATPRAGGYEQVLATEGQRPAEHSLAAFLTDHAVEWIERQDAPWFAHLSYWRPHPPVRRSRPLVAAPTRPTRSSCRSRPSPSATRCTTPRCGLPEAAAPA